MITIAKKAEKTITHHPGTITLDQVYNIVVIKTANGATGYDVLVLDIDDEVKRKLIVETVIANLNKEQCVWS